MLFGTNRYFVQIPAVIRGFQFTVEVYFVGLMHRC